MLQDLPADQPLVRKRQGAVEWIIFNRPASRNALTHEMETSLTRIFRELGNDKSVRALVMTGAPGNKPAFIAGQDMGDLENAASPEASMDLEATSETMMEALEALRIPTISAMAGACVGAGALIAAACDVRIAAPSLRFGFPIARTVGVCLSLRNYARLSALIGPARTKDLVFDATLLNAEASLAAGAVKEVVATEGELLPRAQAIGEHLASLAPLTLWSTKESLRRLRDASLPAGEQQDLLLGCYLSSDYQEGIAAFTAKRPPVFTGT
ncbi:MAG: enoyl-CoA hydratase [Comamonadaceae bacterium]|nr:MAG: enoyl-CoA hydratase [Comamonadaceae bacterium]